MTNLIGSAVAVEAWFRDRTWIEERIKDSKLGMALRHPPSGYAAANEVWMWAAFLALSLSTGLQALTDHDHPHRAHGKRLRRELITIPARVVHHARRLLVRLAPDQADGPLIGAYRLLRALPGRQRGRQPPNGTKPTLQRKISIATRGIRSNGPLTTPCLAGVAAATGGWPPAVR